jgi:tetraacyldisaccharide 4'-kinase
MPRLSSFFSDLYGRVAGARRRAFDADPARRERLDRPVISIGNLVVGGSGKTPVTAYIAALLADAGERPAILSRGYRRERADEDVVVVSDGVRLLADFERAGDEPLMMARMLDGHGVRVLVGARRADAGRVAEQRYDATVHLLDDGFQHLALARDVDLLVVSSHDLEGETMLPGGRLREPVDAVRRADALLVTSETLPAARALAARWEIGKAFAVTRTASVPRLIEPYGLAPRVARSAPVLALAGIAQPDRFFDDLLLDGWTQIVDRLSFRDHHAFSDDDLRRIAQRVRDTRAELVLTTEKDVMRLLRKRPLPFPVAWVPQTVNIEPADEFRLWLLWRLAQARTKVRPAERGPQG